MKKTILLAIMIGFISSNFNYVVAQKKVEDKQELIEIFKSDQADRTNHIDRSIRQ